MKYGYKGSYYKNLIKPDLGNKEILERMVIDWKGSTERIMQIKGQLYYGNEHDIL